MNIAEKISKPALIVIDMQNGLFKGQEKPCNDQAILSNIIKLINKARLDHLPIIFIRHVGLLGTPLAPDSSMTQLISELPVDFSQDIVIEKMSPSCFKGTVLKGMLEQLNVNEIIISGMKTEYCVDTTVRAGSDCGFQVTLISDAHTAFDSDYFKAHEVIKHHNNILKNAFAVLKTTDEFTA